MTAQIDKKTFSNLFKINLKNNTKLRKKIMKFIVNELIVENKLKFIYIPKNHRLFEFEEE